MTRRVLEPLGKTCESGKKTCVESRVRSSDDSMEAGAHGKDRVQGVYGEDMVGAPMQDEALCVNAGALDTYGGVCHAQ